MNGNPYTPIVTRNVFGLLPIPPPTPVDTAPVVAPPKITLNGITTILGSKEVSFYKVAMPAKPGQPAQDQSYMMGEGESDNDIQVVKIDTDADVVIFSCNHGTIQQLPFDRGRGIFPAVLFHRRVALRPACHCPATVSAGPADRDSEAAMSPAAMPILHKLQMPVARQ